MAMCSQAHHDAEDILNNFMINSLNDSEDLPRRLENEKDQFSIYMLLCGIHYYLEALGALGDRFGIPTVIQQSSQSDNVIHQMLVDFRDGKSGSGELAEWHPKSEI